jgi:hypothetical protein
VRSSGKTPYYLCDSYLIFTLEDHVVDRLWGKKLFRKLLARLTEKEQRYLFIYAHISGPADDIVICSPYDAFKLLQTAAAWLIYLNDSKFIRAICELPSYFLTEEQKEVQKLFEEVEDDNRRWVYRF